MLKELLDQAAPQLIAERGIGYVTAAEFYIAWSHPGRCHSEAAFARLGGTSPVEATSGQNQTRHRLNRGGDRQRRRRHSQVRPALICRDLATRAGWDRLAVGGTGEMIRSRRFAEGVAVKLLSLRGGVTLVAATGMCFSACGDDGDIASTVPVVDTTTGASSSTRVSTLATTTSMTPPASTTPPPLTTLPATTAPPTSSVTAPSVPTAIPGADQLAGEADPEELADIEAHRSLWESMKPTEYTMVIHRPTNEPSAMFTDCATTNPLRVIVVDHRPVEVTGLSSGCSLPADESVPTVEGLFDLAATAAAAAEHSIVLDDRWGYVNSIDAFEGTFGAFGGVRWLVPAAAPAHVDVQVEPALDQARRIWDASHPSDYSFDLLYEVFNLLGGTYRVAVADGQPVGIERTDGLPFDKSLAAELPGTIEEVFDVITDNLDRDPDLVIAGIHPELGYPTDATFDHSRDSIDDEFAIVVTNFETA